MLGLAISDKSFASISSSFFVHTFNETLYSEQIHLVAFLF